MKSRAELKKLYGKGYVEIFQQKQSLYRLERLLEYMNIDSDHSVADFGCGSGILMELIASKVKSYVGIDFSEAFIKTAKQKKKQLSIHNAEFFCMDINEFCQKHIRMFDVGFAMDFSEHVYDEEWERILRSIRMSLKPGGRLYLHTPNASFFLERMKSKNFIVKQFPEHVAVRSLEDNVSLIKKAGFIVTQVRLLPHYNILRFVHPLSYIPFAGKYFSARIFIEAAV